MQLRVAVDRPWDIPGDILVVPIVGEPDWTGPLGELDRRARGELRALQAFGELRTKRFTSALAASGDVKAERIMLLSVGSADHLDRETVVRSAAAAMHRLGGRR